MLRSASSWTSAGPKRPATRRLAIERLDDRLVMAADFQWAFALDKEGDVSIGKVVTDADGHAIVIGSVIAGGALDVDPSPAEMVLNLPDDGQFVAEYDASGSLVWATAITGSGGPGLTTLAAMGQGPSQSIVLAGIVVHRDETGGGAHGGDVVWAGDTVLASLQLGEGFLIRLDTDGQLEWAHSIGTATTPRDLALDSAGNVVTAGSGGAGWFLAKYNAAAGTQTWRNDFASTYSDARGIALDSSGRIVVGGSYRGNVDFDAGPKKVNLSSQSTTGFLAAYSSSGSLVWARSFSPAINARAFVFDVGVDANNNVYAVGNYEGRVDFDPGKGKFELPNTAERKAYVMKLTSSGNFAWAKSLNGAGDAWSLAHSLDVDSSGNLYIAGAFSGTIDFDPGASQHLLTSSPQLYAQGFLLKLNSDGNLAYVLTVGPGEVGWAFALAPGGRILLAGGMNGSVDFDPDAVDEAILTADGAGFLWSLLDS